jgi:hypothetical protein
MSTILFGTAILLLLIVGLYRRKRQEKEWVKEERYEDSGTWIDKRAGERGTYGRLDHERELERSHLYRTGRIQELIRDIEREMDWIPGRHSRAIREKLDELVALVNLILEGKLPSTPPELTAQDTRAQDLQKIILSTFFEIFPGLLNADIQHLKLLDTHVMNKAVELITLHK